MSVSQYPTDCLWVVPDCRSAQDSRLAAAIVCRILATAAALVGGTGGFSTDRRRVTAAPHFYFVLQIVFIGWIEPSPRTNQKQSESPGPCSAVEAASLAPSLAPRASARLFLISAITFCKGGVVTRTGSICRDTEHWTRTHLVRLRQVSLLSFSEVGLCWGRGVTGTTAILGSVVCSRGF